MNEVRRMEIEHALFSSNTLPEKWKAPTNFAWYVIVLAPNWRFFVSSENRMVWTHYKWPSDIPDHLNVCFQFSEPRIRFLKSDRVHGPYVRWVLTQTDSIGKIRIHVLNSFQTVVRELSYPYNDSNLFENTLWNRWHNQFISVSVKPGGVKSHKFIHHFRFRTRL